MCFILVSSGVFAYSLALRIKGINNSACLQILFIYIHQLNSVGFRESLLCVTLTHLLMNDKVLHALHKLVFHHFIHLCITF